MLQTTLYRLPSPEPHPVVIINHGSTGPGVVPVSEVYRAGNEASFYRSLGYIVVVPMRKGRGASDGTFFEESEDQAVELDSAIEDLNAVVEFMTKQPDVDPTRIVVTGVSRGGLLAVAYAERYPTNVIGVINFSGGWWGEHTPNADFNFEEFRKAGRNAKIPMLWLYADHDSYYSLDFVEREFAVFRSAGGRGDLFEVRDLPGEGHFLCAWLDRWQVKVTDYLKEINKMLNQSPPPSSNSVPVTLPTSKTSGVVPILHP
jgi:dienelactone hydrolase